MQVEKGMKDLSVVLNKEQCALQGILWCTQHLGWLRGRRLPIMGEVDDSADLCGVDTNSMRSEPK